VNTKNKSNLLKKNIILAILVVLISFVPLLYLKNAEFSGADTRAKEAIAEVAPNYKPWFSPILEPQSGEIETFLFALQAAIGSGGVCYYLGYIKGKSKKDEGKDE